MIEPSKNSGASVAAGEAWLEIVRQKAGAVRFGVVQIEQTEKIRLGASPAIVSKAAY